MSHPEKVDCKINLYTSNWLTATRNNSVRRILLLTITGPFEKDEDQTMPFLQSTYLAYILAASPIWFWIW
jgi:hypothetical protein